MYVLCFISSAHVVVKQAPYWQDPLMPRTGIELSWNRFPAERLSVSITFSDILLVSGLEVLLKLFQPDIGVLATVKVLTVTLLANGECGAQLLREV